MASSLSISFIGSHLVCPTCFQCLHSFSAPLSLILVLFTCLILGKKRGGIEVEPLYLPVYADAALGTSVFKTLKSEYEQKKRWAWGVSDDPWIIKNYLLVPGIPFWEKTMRLLTVIQTHFLWPVHFFILSVGIQIPVLLNPRFARTTLGCCYV